jgi:plastocyanin
MRVMLAILLAASLALAACGGSSKSSSSTGSSGGSSSGSSGGSSSGSSGSSGGGSSSLKLTANPSGQLKFNTTKLSAKAGTVTLDMTNPSQVPHGIAVQGNGVAQVGKVVGHGGSSTVSVKLKPGTYTFYCPVPGHRQAGMQGTLTVK